MIQSNDRSGYIGASDTSIVVGNWNTKTFEKYSYDLGYIDNGMYPVGNTLNDNLDKTRAWFDKTIDISKCVEWLIEDEYTTGQVISINGGWVII